MTASPAGELLTPLPGALIEPKPDLMKGAQGWRKAVDWVSFGRRTVDWLLVDGQTPGSGEAYDWRALRVPRGASRRGWRSRHRCTALLGWRAVPAAVEELFCRSA